MPVIWTGDHDSNASVPDVPPGAVRLTVVVPAACAGAVKVTVVAVVAVGVTVVPHTLTAVTPVQLVPVATNAAPPPAMSLSAKLRLARVGAATVAEAPNE